jgi:hypothetical protein
MQVFLMKQSWVLNYGLERIVQSLGCWGEKVPMLRVEIEFCEITTNMQIDVNDGDINNEGVGEVVVKVACVESNLVVQ